MCRTMLCGTRNCATVGCPNTPASESATIWSLSFRAGSAVVLVSGGSGFAGPVSGAAAGAGCCTTGAGAGALAA